MGHHPLPVGGVDVVDHGGLEDVVVPRVQLHGGRHLHGGFESKLGWDLGGTIGKKIKKSRGDVQMTFEMSLPPISAKSTHPPFL